MKLKIVSYNCGGIKSNPDLINNLLSKSDIVFLQETILTEHNANFLQTFDKSFSFDFKNGSRNDDVFYGRASGGLVIFWKSQLNHYIKKFETSSNRINGIIIENTDKRKFLFPNCYLPCDYRTHESLLQYESCLNDIELILNSDTDTFDEVCFTGDFNCDVSN